MNILLIIVIIITGLCVWRGFARGLFRTVLIAGATILAMVLSAYATPYVSEALKNYTQIDEKMTDYIVSTLELNTEQLITTKTEEMTAIDNLRVPEALKMALVNHNNSSMYDLLGIHGFYEYIAQYLTGFFINCLAYVVIQVVLTVFLMILLYSTNLLKEIPIINGIDKMGGVLLGLVQALAIIWSVFVLISLFGNTEFGMQLYDQISGNFILNYLYEHNLLLNTITKIAGL